MRLWKLRHYSAYACYTLCMRPPPDALKNLSCAQAEPFPGTRGLQGPWSAPPIWTEQARCCAQISPATQGQEAPAPDQTPHL